MNENTVPVTSGAQPTMSNSDERFTHQYGIRQTDKDGNAGVMYAPDANGRPNKVANFSVQPLSMVQGPDGMEFIVALIAQRPKGDGTYSIKHFSDTRTGKRAVEMLGVPDVEIREENLQPDQFELTHRAIKLTSGQLLNRAQFRKRCIEHGNYHFYGTDAVYDNLLGYILDEASKGKVVWLPGWNEAAGAYFFANKVLVPKVDALIYLNYDKVGVVEIEGVRYHAPFALQDNFDMPCLVDEGSISHHDWSALVRKVHGDAGMVAVMFHAASLFSSVIFNHLRSFPVLYLHGGPASGKTALATALLCSFRLGQRPITLTPFNADHQFEKIPCLSCADTIIGVEGFSSLMGAAHIETIKRLSDRISRLHPILSSFVLTSSDAPYGDAALSSRMVVLNMDRSTNVYSDAEKKAFDDLSAVVANGCGRVVTDLLQHRHLVREGFHTEFRHAYIEMKADHRHSHERVLQNTAILLAIYDVLAKEIAWPWERNELVNALQRVVDSHDTGSGAPNAAKA